MKIIMRALTGGTAIVVANVLLSSLGVPSYVGLNGVTLVVCGLLGFPGVVGLYGLSFYQLLI